MAGKTKLNVVTDGLIAYFDSENKNSNLIKNFGEIQDTTAIAKNMVYDYENKNFFNLTNYGKVDFLISNSFGSFGNDTTTFVNYLNRFPMWRFGNYKIQDVLLYDIQKQSADLKFPTNSTGFTISIWIVVPEISFEKFDKYLQLMKFDTIEGLIKNIEFSLVREGDGFSLIQQYSDQNTSGTGAGQLRMFPGYIYNIVIVFDSERVPEDQVNVFINNKPDLNYQESANGNSFSRSSLWRLRNVFGFSKDLDFSQKTFLFSILSIYNRALSEKEIYQNYKVIEPRYRHYIGPTE